MRVIEIFNSIDGEVNHWGQGSLSTFIRFAGCNLQCTYCDTPDSRSSTAGTDMTIDDIVAEVNDRGCKKVTITGGEPLLQTELPDLLNALMAQQCLISIETNGSIKPPMFSPMISWVMDYKIHSMHEMSIRNFMGLRRMDWVKFVVSAEDECYAAESIMNEIKQVCDANFAFSPLIPKMSPHQLLSFLQRRGLWNVRMNIQIHKFIQVR